MASLPYPPRPGQEALVADIEAAQREGGHLVTEAGTGTGKTISALTASATTSNTDGRRIIYLTRTNSQQGQVVAEHAALVKSGQEPGLLIPFMGRRQYCPLLRSDERFRDGTPEELGRLCRDAKAKAARMHDTGKPVAGACPNYLRLLQDGPGPVEALLSEGGFDGGSLAARIEKAGSCPYEALKLLLPKARTVVVPYIFLLDDKLRTTFMQWIGAGADECHLIVDEAHNLAPAARDHHSPRLTWTTLQRALSEAEEYKDPVLAGEHLATTVLDAMLGAVRTLADEYVRGSDDGLVPPGALVETMLTRLRVPSPVLERIASDLVQWGESIREDRRSKGRLPRSYLGSLGQFITNWLGLGDAPYVHLVTGGDQPSLELYLLDPAAVLSWLGDFWSTLHMSGTLAPLQEHQDLCGLGPSRTRRVLHPSPFDPTHLRTFGLEGVHRRFEAMQRDPGLVVRQQEAAVAALRHLPGRTALWFPSHQMLGDYLEEDFLHGVDRPRYAERPDMNTAELTRLVAAFRSDPRSGALLLGVLGGRLTEGIDFPGDALEGVIIFGIPYPRPSARSQALIHHFDRRCGKGWEYAVHNPTGRTLRQAVGRLIRGPDDRGTAIILDERIVRFHGHLPGLAMLPAVDALGEVAAQPPDRAEMAYTTADKLANQP